MRTKKAARMWRGASLIVIALLVISCGLASVAEANNVMLDDFFSSRSYKIVTEVVEGEDPYNYKPDYANTTELVNAHKDLAERLQEEGSVLLKNTGSALPLAEGQKVSLLGMRSY